MLTRIDRVTIGVPDLEAGIEAYMRIGFDVRVIGGYALALNDEDYLELSTGHGPGLRSIALQSEDLVADAAAMNARGVIQYLRLVPQRRPQERVAGHHPNGVLRLERVYIAVADVAAAAAEYARVLGMPAPKMERGTVINADMAVFDIGPTGLTLAQPAGPGVAADALARAPGPFQVLYRTSSMNAAARWMEEHGVPPPKRGIRNTGEHAMLVTPEYACGAYIGFVGPA